MKWIVLLLLCIVLISGCVVKTSISELANNPAKYINKIVSVEGRTKVINTMCTTTVCTEENPCCNTCAGHLALTKDDYSILLFGEYNNSRIGCRGSECSIICYPLKAGKNYKVTGIWKIGALYFLEITDFEEI